MTHICSSCIAANSEIKKNIKESETKLIEEKKKTKNYQKI